LAVSVAPIFCCAAKAGAMKQTPKSAADLKALADSRVSIVLTCQKE
jgi:hypothetical protein